MTFVTHVYQNLLNIGKLWGTNEPAIEAANLAGVCTIR